MTVVDCEFASFWHGQLNPFAYACLSSFPQAGVSMRVYSYDPRLELPPGVRREDARTICPDESLIGRFIANGKSSIATFADFFRYRMMHETGFCWVDTDMLCLSRPALSNDGFVFCRQADAVGTSLVNNAVLRLPPTSPALAELIAAAEAAIDVDQRWGAIGPFLLTPVLAKHGLTRYALDSHICYPIEPEQFWKLFLPSYREWAENATRGASFVHLWSEAIAWSGYDFWACPPAGSYLHDAFERLGALDRFRRFAPEDEVLRLMAKPIADSQHTARPGAVCSD
ncbi:MAG: hypothetical protein JO136_24010 [Hyphomicrobiales bacterium]|nr:hypothetical protein [Hyphomicrobiales bacterium]